MRPLAEKQERQRLLTDIINGSAITGQSQLVRLLRKKGFAVTQASVSRDLDDLGISKTDGVYKRQPAQKRPEFGSLSFETSGDNLIVARCSSGLASALAVHLDMISFEGVVGTLAGDDTVFIAVRDKKSQKHLLPILRNEFDVD